MFGECCTAWSPACYFKMHSLDHIYRSTWQERNWGRAYSWRSLGSGQVLVLNVLFSTGKTIFCRERASGHSLGQAQSSGKDDMPHCHQVPWYFHLFRVIRQEPPSKMNCRNLSALCHFHRNHRDDLHKHASGNQTWGVHLVYGTFFCTCCAYKVNRFSLCLNCTRSLNWAGAKVMESKFWSPASWYDTSPGT